MARQDKTDKANDIDQLYTQYEPNLLSRSEGEAARMVPQAAFFNANQSLCQLTDRVSKRMAAYTSDGTFNMKTFHDETKGTMGWKLRPPNTFNTSVIFNQMHLLVYDKPPGLEAIFQTKNKTAFDRFVTSALSHSGLEVDPISYAWGSQMEEYDRAPEAEDQRASEEEDSHASKAKSWTESLRQFLPFK